MRRKDRINLGIGIGDWGLGIGDSRKANVNINTNVRKSEGHPELVSGSNGTGKISIRMPSSS